MVVWWWSFLCGRFLRFRRSRCYWPLHIQGQARRSRERTTGPYLPVWIRTWLWMCHQSSIRPYPGVPLLRCPCARAAGNLRSNRAVLVRAANHLLARTAAMPRLNGRNMPTERAAQQDARCYFHFRLNSSVMLVDAEVENCPLPCEPLFRYCCNRICTDF